MNRLMCFLTGGHRYSDANIKTEVAPDDWNIVTITNPCVKCGDLSVYHMNIGKLNKVKTAYQRMLEIKKEREMSGYQVEDPQIVAEKTIEALSGFKQYKNSELINEYRRH